MGFGGTLKSVILGVTGVMEWWSIETTGIMRRFD
jgi:hypothetical protein